MSKDNKKLIKDIDKYIRKKPSKTVVTSVRVDRVTYDLIKRYEINLNKFINDKLKELLNDLK